MKNWLDARLKLRHLQCLVTVASHRSVLRAADSLAQTPSAVSKNLTELEEILGVQLFVRKRAGLQITPVGETFLNYASQAFGSLQEGFLAIDEGRSVSMPLYVGVLPTAASSILPNAILRLCTEYSDTVVIVHTGVNADLLKQLKLGELNLVIGRLADPTEMYGLSFEPLYAEPLVMAVRPQHPLAATDLKVEDIGSFPMILPPGGTMIRREADSFFIASGIGMPRQRIETLSNSVARSLLRQSDAIWFCPLGVVADDLRNAGAMRLQISTESTIASVGLSTLSDAPVSSALKFFMEAIREAAREQRRPEVAN
jgi:LysR family transcriptional regulator, pca operon transcriptional activator